MTDSKVGRKETTSDDADAYDLTALPILEYLALEQLCCDRAGTVRHSLGQLRLQTFGKALVAFAGDDRQHIDVVDIFTQCIGVHALAVLIDTEAKAPADFLALADLAAASLQGADLEYIWVIPAFSEGGVREDEADGRLLRVPVQKQFLVLHDQMVVDAATAQAIYFDMVVNGYVTKQGQLTDKYYTDKANHTLQIAEEVADCAGAVMAILDHIYDSRAMKPENARGQNVELKVRADKLAMPEFKALWEHISTKSVYVVDFDTDELVRKAIVALDSKLRVSKIFFKVETGTMEEVKSRDTLLSGGAFTKKTSETYGQENKIHANRHVKYDLVGKLVDETGLTRKAVVAILTGIEKVVFDQFKDNAV